MAAASSAVTRPIVVGSVAQWLGKRAEESKSHEWTVHVRASSPDEDLSSWVKKVVFQLHPSLQPPTRGAHKPLAAAPKPLAAAPKPLAPAPAPPERAAALRLAVVEAPPFEVTEMGWGEFEIHFQIFFHGMARPFETSHMLKLYPDGDNQLRWPRCLGVEGGALVG